MLAINAGWRGENTDDLKFLNAMVGPSLFFAYIIIIGKLQGQGPIINTAAEKYIHFRFD